MLTQVVTLVNELRLEQADPDTKGDLFEHVLRQIKQAGELGQFRTPRHIIRAIVDLVDPKIGEMVYDPAAGTAGFLVAAYEHIRLANSSPNGRETAEIEGKTFERGLWRPAQPAAVAPVTNGDVLRQRRGREDGQSCLDGSGAARPSRRANSQAQRADDNASIGRGRRRRGLPLDGYDVILANPPFSGRIDRDRIVDDVRVGTTTATELLFVKYMVDNLKTGGRCGVIVPEGRAVRLDRRAQGAAPHTDAEQPRRSGAIAARRRVSALFGRKNLGSDLPAGGRTERVMFLHSDNDGYKLDANHDQPIEADDLPGLIAAFSSRQERWTEWQARDANTPWREKWWFAEAETIERQDWNLSASHYRPESREAAEHRDPRELLAELRDETAAILGDIEALAAELEERAA